MIKQGHMLRVTSWENDGDCYNTKTFDGLSLPQVIALVAFCKFLGQNCSDQDYDVSLASFKYDNFPSIPGMIDEFDPTVGDWDEYLQDIVYSLVGYAYESGTLRVMDKYDVHYIPCDIQEVTI